MQLKRKFSDIRGALTLATCATLQGTSHAAGVGAGQWQLDSALLYYGEKDRVEVFEPTLFATKSLSESESLTLRGIFDTMSGATPNGAVPAAAPQTFTSPSGNPYTVAPNKPPTMDFEDLRGAVGFDWVKETADRVKRTLSGDLSAEKDYSSIGGSVSYAFDGEARMRTLAIGAGFSYDAVDPDGGKPPELSLLSAYSSTGGGRALGGDTARRDDDEGEDGDGGDDFSLFQGERKLSAQLLLGVTQVLSRRALVQFNYTLSLNSGYLNDPYKVVSLVDSSGAPVDALFEKRPDHRSGNALFGKFVYHLPRDVVHLSYRYYWDDWGIRSHTTDLSYRMALWEGAYLQPHLRYYRQTQADFYHTALLDTASRPDYASADYRLAEMQSTTAGLKLGIPTGPHAELSLRAEFMKQTGENHPADAIGRLRELDLYPGLEAIILQFGYSLEF